MNSQLTIVLTSLLLASCGAAPDANRGGDAPAQTNATGMEAANAASAPIGQSEAPAGNEADTQDISECLKQDGERLAEMNLHAIGTEPFWGADVKGRCVTYSNPENQAGTRVWTQFSGSDESGTWSGYLDDSRFVMKTRPQEGCSDGMSDRRYPIAVTLTVKGEVRRGCAERR